MKDSNGYPRFQWSRFANGKGEQFVVRADSFEELKKGKDEVETDLIFEEDVKETLPKVNELPKEFTDISMGGPELCPLDGEKLGWLTSKAGKKFWAHVLEPGKWCFGKHKEY